MKRRNSLSVVTADTDENAYNPMLKMLTDLANGCRKHVFLTFFSDKWWESMHKLATHLPSSGYCEEGLAFLILIGTSIIKGKNSHPFFCSIVKVAAVF